MSAKDAKQVVYRYNGDPNSEEVEQDIDGVLRIPLKDELVSRNGKPWKVVHVSIEQSLNANGPISVLRLFLTDQF
jgi:hypothetical protein